MFGFAGNCDWNVSRGGVAGVIVETNGATASALPSIRVRFDTVSTNELEAGAAWVDCTNGGVTKRLRRTIFKVTVDEFNTSTTVDAACTLRYRAAMGAHTDKAGHNKPGDDGSTWYVGKIMVRFAILPTNIPWSSRGINFLFDFNTHPPAVISKGMCVAMRYKLGTDAFQFVGDANRRFYPTTPLAAWVNDGEADVGDCQYPSNAVPNVMYRKDNPGFENVDSGGNALKQGFKHKNFREFVQFYNGTSWVRICEYGFWFTNSTATLPTGAPVAPNEVGTGSLAVNFPNTQPVVVAGPPQTVAQGATVTLTATVTEADNDQIIRHTWRQVSGTAVVLSTPGAISTTFTAPASAGALVFEIIVVDNSGGMNFSPGNHTSAPSTVTITVT